MIGNGASAIQFIPEIAQEPPSAHDLPALGELGDPAQRPRVSATPSKERFRRHPRLLRALRAFIWFMLEIALLRVPARELVLAAHDARRHASTCTPRSSDPELRAKLTPDYPIGCKRILISDDYYQALARPNVEVVGEPIDARRARRRRDRRRRRAPADTIIFGTGFETTTFLAPLAIEGLDGAQARRKSGATAPRRISASPSRVSPTSSCSTGRTQSRPQLDHLHDRVPGRLRRAVHPGSCGSGPRLDRRAARRDGSLQRASSRRRSARPPGPPAAQLVQDRLGQDHNNWSGFTVDYWRRTRHPDWHDYRFAPHRA